MQFSQACFFVSALVCLALADHVSKPKSNFDETVGDIVSSYTNLDLGVDVDWQPFHWEKNEEGIFLVDRVFHIKLQEPATLQVVDYRFSGDVFDIVNAMTTDIVGSTSAKVDTDGNIAYAETPEDAWGDKRFGRLEFSVGPEATHQIFAIKIASSNYDSGTGAVRLVKK
ncbi:hypothetical protein BC940DRAFT_352610 [Gongronella butleri]|nr:hypothetical protein BC940DRAFT_352610 [Gongronella butleri]